MDELAIRSGVDVISITRVEQAVERSESFKHHNFSKREIEYCESRTHPPRHFAGRWCVKEAFMKTMYELGAENNIRYNKIAVHGDGSPELVLHEDVRRLLESKLIGEGRSYKVSISITHDSSIDVAIGSCTMFIRPHP